MNASLPAVERLLSACETRPLTAPDVELVMDARAEMDMLRRMSRLLSRLGGRQRRRARGHADAD